MQLLVKLQVALQDKGTFFCFNFILLYSEKYEIYIIINKIN
jgi:hypothetical protein